MGSLLLIILLKMRCFTNFLLLINVVANEQCNDEQLALDCIDQCIATHDHCRHECDKNAQCLIECGGALNQCLTYCPCQSGCPSGCVGCQSPFCQAFQCDDPEANEDYVACQEKG